MRHLLLLLVFSGWTVNLLPAQIQRIMHQTFPVGDSIAEINMDIYGEYKIETWPGNTILLETQVKLYNATPGILEHFLEAGRFELEAKQEESRLLLVSKDKERRPITTSKGECFEEVNQRLFIPEEFEPGGEHRWVRPLEGKKTATPVPDSTATNKPVPETDATKKEGSSDNG